MGSDKDAAAGAAAPGGNTASSVQCWDPDQDPALGIESIGRDALAHRHALLLVAGPSVRDDGWAGWAHDAAIALARELSERGRQVVLADLDFSEPALHARLGEPNADGISDVFFFGASLEHVTLTWSARPFAIIPSGAGVLDPRVVFEHPDWARLLACFEAADDPAGDLLLAFAPAEAPGLHALALSIGAAILLGDEHECETIRQAWPVGVQVLAAFAPVTAAAEIRPSREMLVPRPIVGGPGEQRTTVTAVDDATAGAPPVERDEARQHRLARALTLAAVLLLSVLVGLWHFGASDIPLANVAADPRAGVAATPQAGPPAPTAGLAAGERLPYAVTIEIHQDMAAATRRVESLEREASAVGFFIAPIFVDSAIAYRVLAGPVRDSATAARLMEWLVDNGHTTGRSEWGIRARPYAFLLGEYDRRDEAEQRRAQLADRGIPSYVLEMADADAAPSRFFLYAGAYSGAAEAEVMRRLLRNEGIADSLVERRGRSPQ